MDALDQNPRHERYCTCQAGRRYCDPVEPYCNGGQPKHLDERPDATTSPFLTQACDAVSAEAEQEYRRAVEARLEAGEREYGRFQYLKADCDEMAVEESYDIGGWLLLSDHQLELDLEHGRVTPGIGKMIRELRLDATRHALGAYEAAREAGKLYASTLELYGDDAHPTPQAEAQAGRALAGV